ncbi:hypothetical protein KB553_17645 [Chryseobacterium rhizoplanae]|uniref:hypothetical protein n=1 Tax=Chryseobacterium rhizoplanae TaxID=1609531 RepID=UPI001CE35647|nr:hypothetical protein [Chryseobacterium rhizoplanae]UCA58865.1 hypothetical protein KB553_17645 [Chryseobacterium rhizoplanae]
MKKICLSLFLLSATLIVYAQTGNDNVFMSSDKIFTLGGKRAKSGEYKIDGNPYSNSKNFEQVTIEGYSKNVQDLRYNAYADEMEYLNKNETYYADKIDGLTVTFPSLKKTYIVKHYTYMGNEKFGYLVLLSRKDAKYGLFKREKVELMQGEKSVNAFAKDANDYYAKEKDVYLVSKGNTYYKLPKNVDELSEDLSLDAKSVKEFAKSNKINFNKEEDLVKLFDFINK